MIALILILTACKQDHKSSVAIGEPAIIPLPVTMKIKSGSFTIGKNTAIYCKSKDLLTSGRLLAGKLGITEVREGSGHGLNLLISETEEKGLGQEGYKLIVAEDRVTITANKPNGIFYGIQSLLQMLPVQNQCSQVKEAGNLQIRCVEIVDFPRFKWRGLLLDVSRHFFTIDEVKKMIDQMVSVQIQYSAASSY